MRSNDELIEIRVNDIGAFLRLNRWKLIIGGLLGLIVGLLYAFSKPNQYSSQVTVMPEVQGKSSSLGSLGSLAGLAGINLENLSSAGESIRPDLYPNVLQSVPFALHLLRQPVYSKEFKRTQPLETYLTKHGENTFGGWLFNFLSSDNKKQTELDDPQNSSGALQVTKEQDINIKDIQVRVTAQYDKKTGIITLEATMPDPVVAATVVRRSLDYLTDYAISYRTEKARQQVRFLNAQVTASKRRYQEAEMNLSSYRDKNRGLYLNTAKIEEQRIQAEYILSQDLYNNLSKQLEMAKIKVQEETPVFKILEPAQVPLRKSGPKRMMIALGFAIVGFIIVGAWLLVQLVISNKHKSVYA